MNILYEDDAILVCVKPVGVLSQGETQDSMVVLLSEYCKKTVYPVHRLDRAVGGLMVYAKTRMAVAELARQVQEQRMKKEYLAVIHGKMEKKTAVLRDILFKDSTKNKSYTVKTMRKGAKRASLEYRVLCETEEASLVHVLLHTGRTHQIRVQFASRRHPLVGDGKYGARDSAKHPALWSAGLTFLHPITGKMLQFRKMPTAQDMPWAQFSIPETDMSIRPATVRDIDAVVAIYDAIHMMEEQGKAEIGWKRGVYPTRKTARVGIASGDMFVYTEENGKILAAARLNAIQCPQYREAEWKNVVPDEAVLVMHTLTVDPCAQGKHIGLSMLRFYEVYAREKGCKELRIDTNERNATARAFYAKYGYTEVGIISGEFNGLPEVRLVCMEKGLEEEN